MRKAFELHAADISAPGLPMELQEEYRRFGYTSGQSVTTLVERAARQWPHQTALIEGERRFSYGELELLVQRSVSWLQAAGVRPGHTVVWQVPNWWESQVLALAIWQVGAVSVPVVPFYREHELRQILEQVRPALVISTCEYRGFAHAEAYDDLLHDLGLTDTRKVVVRGERVGWTPVQQVLANVARTVAVRPGPDEPCLVLFTSGTTSAPKGAVHSSRTFLAESRQLVDAWGLSWEDVAYMAAPLQHITGLLNAVTLPLLVGATSVLAERWEPDKAVLDMLRHGVTYTAGATVFLQELTEAASSAGARLPLRMFTCGGAAVPRAVMERSEEQGIPAARVYGMTELPTVTVMNRSFPFDLRAQTDGAIAPGVEVRVVDEGSALLPTGAMGELCVRGPERMLGYLDEASNRAAVDHEGWFRTGDVGFVDDRACVTVTGRLKDIINRGGEKFSARDIEDLLASHPAVRQAAVVPRPDLRLGEVPVAFVVLEPASVATSEELVSHVLAAGLAKQKTPVEWHFPAALPMTPSGKVRKVELVPTTKEM